VVCRECSWVGVWCAAIAAGLVCGVLRVQLDWCVVCCECSWIGVWCAESAAGLLDLLLVYMIYGKVYSCNPGLKTI